MRSKIPNKAYISDVTTEGSILNLRTMRPNISLSVVYCFRC